MKVQYFTPVYFDQKTNTQKTVCYHVNANRNWNRNTPIISNPLLTEINYEVNDFNEGSVGPLKHTL